MGLLRASASCSNSAWAPAHPRPQSSVIFDEPSEEIGQCVELGFGGTDRRLRRQEAGIGGNGAGRRILQRDVAGNDHHGDTTLAHRGTDGILQDERELGRIGDELAIVAALGEQGLRVCLLEVAGSDLCRGDMCGDGQDGSPGSMAIEQAVDEMDMAWPAGARTDRQLPGDLTFRAGREGADLFVAHMHPVDDAPRPDRLGHGVEAVADDTVDPSYPHLLEGFDDEIRDGIDLHGSRSCFRTRTMLRRTRSRGPLSVTHACHSAISLTRGAITAKRSPRVARLAA